MASHKRRAGGAIYRALIELITGKRPRWAQIAVNQLNPFIFHELTLSLNFRCQGALHLHGYRVQSSGTASSGERRKFAFELLPPESRMRHFHFYTDSENDRKRCADRPIPQTPPQAGATNKSNESINASFLR